MVFWSAGLQRFIARQLFGWESWFSIDASKCALELLLSKENLRCCLEQGCVTKVKEGYQKGTQLAVATLDCRGG